MPFERTLGEQLQIVDPPCQHLRSKSIYVSGQLKTPETLEESNAQHCWCNLTQHVLGPDAEFVGRPQCLPGRQCYQAVF